MLPGIVTRDPIPPRGSGREDGCGMARKPRGAQYVTAYNSRPYPVMVDSEGHLMDGSSWRVVNTDDPITARLIERGTLIIKEGQ